MTTIIECINVWKCYGRSPRGIKELLIGKSKQRESRFSRNWALQDVSFNIDKGCSFGIVGHNGTGKSTLLSLILGSIKPDKGSIKCNGRVASLLELGAGFHPELSGKENIYLYGSILGLTLHEINQEINNIIEFSELGGAINNPIRTYSNGMIARLGFSVIIHSPADVLLIDEVLAVGDSRFQLKCYKFLHDFREKGGTLVIVSHEMATLKAVCDMGICIDMGRVVYSGNIDGVISHHRKLMQQSKMDNADRLAS